MPDPTLKTDTPKSPTLDYGPPPLRLGERLARRLPSSEQLASFFKQFVWVAPLTLLIWVYAEREQVVIQPGITIPIDVRTNDHGRTVRLRRPDDKLIVVELSGSRANMDRVRALLKPKEDGTAPILINVDQKLAVGGKDLQTVNEIANHPIFVNNGISVKSAQPPYLYVDIDEFEERDVLVQAPPDVAGKLTGQTFDPASIRVRAPTQVFKAAEAKGPLVVYADLSKREELNPTAGGGTKVVKNVPIYWAQRDNVTLSPATVNATLDLQVGARSIILKSVPIYLESPFGFTDRFTVKYTETIPNVTLTGPGALIESVEKGDIRIRARLPVTFANANTTDEQNTPLLFELHGLTLTKETAEKIDWKFTITPRVP